MNNILEIKNLDLFFSSDKKEFQALYDINLSFERGKIHSIVGESGCGKTMTAMSIMRLLPKNAHIKNGEILFNGENLLTYKDSQMRNLRGNKIALIPQDPMTSLNPLYTIGSQLVEVIKTAVPMKFRIDKHPARQIFQAIRIEVNKELDVIEPALEQALSLLKVGGRVAVITFHSLEDRLVKNFFKEKCAIDERLKGMPNIPEEYLPDFNLVVNKAISPSDEELENNPRARSAKLRVIERIK